MASVSTTAPRTERVAYGKLWWIGLLAIAAAAIINSIVRLIAVALFPISDEFLPMNIFSPIIFSAIGLIAGLIVFAIIGAFAKNPLRIFNIVAWVFLLLSIIPNILMIIDPSTAPFPGATAPGAIALILMHIVAGVTIIYALNRWGTTRS